MAAAPKAGHGFKNGDLVEVFCRMPFGQDNGQERVDQLGDRWLYCPLPIMGTNRPRTGWTERWLPATVVEGPGGSQGYVRFRWDVRQWYDWASGDRVDNDPSQLLDGAPAHQVRPRSRNWSLPPAPLSGSGPFLPVSEQHIGGVPVSVSFIVFRWGAARIPIQYDAHSWGRTEGSTVSARFLQLFFDRAVGPRLGWDYEVLTVFVQHSDEFDGISPQHLASLCRGRHTVALYFLWPIQSQMNYGDRSTSTAAYVEHSRFFELVARMEACGIPTRWPHHLSLWRRLSSKDWVPSLSMVPRYHVPLTTRVPRSLVLLDPKRAAQQALATLRHLQSEKRSDDDYAGPVASDWPAAPGSERCVAKLGFSYEGIDVKMVQGEWALADALFQLSTQPGYLNDCVYVQQRVERVDLEARCFVLHGEVVDTLYTRFARIDRGGYVRDYEKAHTADEAMRDWFMNDAAAWQQAMDQIQVLTRRWYNWLLTQASESTVSVRIDYMLQRVRPGVAEVWTGEVGEQGYSMGGVDPIIIFNSVLDSISDDVASNVRPAVKRPHPHR